MTSSSGSFVDDGDPTQLFLLTEMLGRGAFGAVYRAVRRADKCEVAVKVVQASEANADVFFEVDVLRAMRNECPFVVAHLGTYLKDEQMFIALELADRGSLASVLRATRVGLADAQVVGVVWQVVRALDFLHESLLTVHLDVKADNLLLTSAGAVKLADFGSVVMLGDAAPAPSPPSPADAADLGGLKREALLRGSPYWISPEIIVAALQLPGAAPAKELAVTDDGDLMRGPIGVRADIWSLGIAIIELLDTKPPYFDFIPSAVLGHIADATSAPAPRTPGVGEELLALVRLCLQRDPSRRPRASDLMRVPALRRLQTDDARDLCARISPTQPNRAQLPAASAATTAAASMSSSSSSSNVSSEQSTASEQLETLSDVHYAMLDPVRGVDVRRRFWRLTPYENCFIGRDAVTWVSERLRLSRAESVFLLRTMMLRGTFHHVTFSEPFADRHFFYRFAEHDASASSADVAADRCALTESELRNVIALATAPATGVAIKDRRYRLRLFPHCFLGNELVDWMCKHTSLSSLPRSAMRQGAVDACQYLMTLGLIEHVTKSHAFEDHAYFYRFCADTPEEILAQFEAARETAKLQLSAEDVIEIVLKMRCDMTGLDRRDRKWRLRSFPLCFVGQDAVSWMVQHLPIVKGSRSTAVVLGQMLLSRGVFHHVTDGHGTFEDKHLFYRFYLDERRLAREERELTDAIKNVVAAGGGSSTTPVAGDEAAPAPTHSFSLRSSPVRMAAAAAAAAADATSGARASPPPERDAAVDAVDPFVTDVQISRHLKHSSSFRAKSLNAAGLLAGAFEQRSGVSERHVVGLMQIVAGAAAFDVSEAEAATLDVQVAAARALICQCFPHNNAEELARQLKRRVDGTSQRLIGRRQRTLMQNRDALRAIVALAVDGRLCTHAELDEDDVVVLDGGGGGGDDAVRGAPDTCRASLLGVEDVALKRVELPAADSDGAVRRLRREVALLSLIRHPHIVPLVAAHTTSTRPWIALKLQTNGTLESMLLSNYELSWPVRVTWAAELASALQFLHDLDVVHRAVNVCNVLLDDSLRAMLGDLSSARVVDGKTMTLTGQVDGAAAFTAPEVLLQDAAPLVYDKPADVYGFGMLLWSVAARKLPLSGLTAPLLARAVGEGKRPRTVDWPSPAYGALVEQCWSQLPASRPRMASVLDVLTRLQRELAPVGLAPSASPFIADVPSRLSKAASEQAPPRRLSLNLSPSSSPTASPRSRRAFNTSLDLHLLGDQESRSPRSPRSPRTPDAPGSPRSSPRPASTEFAEASDERRRIKTPRSGRARTGSSGASAASSQAAFEISILVGRRRRPVPMRLEPRTTYLQMLHAIQQTYFQDDSRRASSAVYVPSSWLGVFLAAGVEKTAAAKYAAALDEAHMDCEEHLADLTHDDLLELMPAADAQCVERYVRQVASERGGSEAPTPSTAATSSLAFDSQALSRLPSGHALLVLDAHTKEVVGELSEAELSPYETHKALVARRIMPTYRFRREKGGKIEEGTR
jgi:serine/threonine protein kinase